MKHLFQVRLRLFSPLFLLLLFSAYFGLSLPPAAYADDGFFGDYLKSPVFYEMFWENYYDSTNFDLLPQGKIYLDPFGVRDLSGFSWVDPQITKGDRDYSWFLRVENMTYLICFIRSSDPKHRAFLRGWFEEWYEHHKNLQKPNRAAWDLMTAASRAMVLTYYLRQLQLQEHSDSLDAPSDGSLRLVSHLKDTLFDHQQYLSEPKNFDGNSNHGLWEAMGLFETTRVFPGDQIRELALERLSLIVNKSVSETGFHMEHSTAYHFYFLEWLQQYVTYLTSLKDFSWEALQELDARRRMMLEASYFLQDHDGDMPVIGDTDEGKVPEQFRFETTSDEDGLRFDEAAGYAIYKDHRESELKRYVIFNIQSKQPDLPYHYHNDVLAVYYNCGGEVILGDQGRYEYGYSPERWYFVSSAAHNTAVPVSVIAKNPANNDDRLASARFRYIYAKNFGCNADGQSFSFKAALSFNKWKIVRRVVIPKEQPVIEVEDALTGEVPAVILWNIGSDVERIDGIDTSANTASADNRFEWVLVTAKGRRYSMSVSGDERLGEGEFTVEIYKGCEDPFLGWYSPAYLVKEPITVIAIRVMPAKRRPVKVITRLTSME